MESNGKHTALSLSLSSVKLKLEKTACFEEWMMVRGRGWWRKDENGKEKYFRDTRKLCVNIKFGKGFNFNSIFSYISLVHSLSLCFVLGKVMVLLENLWCFYLFYCCLPR